MKIKSISGLSFILLASCAHGIPNSHAPGEIESTRCASSPNFKILLHGGTGPFSENPEKKRVAEDALRLGADALANGRSSLDAVEIVVETLESSGAFNSGRGAVRNSEGVVELDAAIMNGSTLEAGAVGAAKTIASPIRVARALLDSRKAVLLTGQGAEAFALKQGFKPIPASYFKSARALKPGQKHYGTVGAVALDQCGHLAAATSTGGLEGKWPGRLGDSPIVGAGTYANDRTCAVSATGMGEYFLRANAGFRTSAQMEWDHESVDESVKNTLRKIHELGGEGGLIALDRAGHISVEGNTQVEGAWIDQNKIVHWDTPGLVH